MSVTTAFELPPHQWTLVSPLGNFHMLQVREQEVVRLHFGDIRSIPANDTDKYIVTQDYNPRPMILQDGFTYQNQACLFAMPDGNEPVSIVAVTLRNVPQTLVPSSGILPSGKRNQLYLQSILSPVGADFTGLVVSAGTLPPGMSLDPTPVSFGNPATLLGGTPTTAGTYLFSITGTDTEGSITETYSLTIAA